MTIKGALKKYHSIEIELLLAYVIKKPKEFLFMNPERKLTIKQLNNLTKLAKRRQKGEPIAYILGSKGFLGLEFKVNKDVLIPRPETEWVVERAIEKLKNIKFKDQKKTLKILDIGTGSGCIIISLAKALGSKIFSFKPKFYASDVSKKALAVAKSNASSHKVKINFYQSNLFNNINGKFDIIIGNLPYVPSSDYKKLYQDLKFEPKLALVGSKDIYEDFFKQVSAHINPKSIILLEIDPKSEKNIRKWVKMYLPSFVVEVHEDLHKLWRYAVIC